MKHYLEALEDAQNALNLAPQYTEVRWVTSIEFQMFAAALLCLISQRLGIWASLQLLLHEYHQRKRTRITLRNGEKNACQSNWIVHSKVFLLENLNDWLGKKKYLNVCNFICLCVLFLVRYFSILKIYLWMSFSRHAFVKVMPSWQWNNMMQLRSHIQCVCR